MHRQIFPPPGVQEFALSFFLCLSSLTLNENRKDKSEEPRDTIQELVKEKR